MSPHPSVHEEQLAEIEAEHRSRAPRPRWGRRLGCLLVLVLLAGGIGFLFGDRIAPLGDEDGWRRWAGDAENWVRRQVGAVREAEPAEVIQTLRNKTDAIQAAWSRSDQTAVLEKVQALRDDLARRRDAAGETAREHWEALVAQSEQLAEKIRRKQEEVPGELEALRRKIESLEKWRALIPALPGAATPEAPAPQPAPGERRGPAPRPATPPPESAP